MGFLQPKTKVRNEGPRLTQLDGIDSAWGNLRPNIVGTDRVSGNVIWTSQVKQLETTSVTTEGGKGLLAPTTETTTVTYTNFLDLMMSLGQAGAIEILAIWNAGVIIYNIRTDRPAFRWPGLEFVLYDGNAEQLPDPVIAAWAASAVADGGLGDEFLAPAYRGQSTLMFYDFPISDFGDAFPQLSVEVTYKPAGVPYRVDVTKEGPAGDDLNAYYVHTTKDIKTFGPGTGQIIKSVWPDPLEPSYTAASISSLNVSARDGHSISDVDQFAAGGPIVGVYHRLTGGLLRQYQYDTAVLGGASTDYWVGNDGTTWWLDTPLGPLEMTCEVVTVSGVTGYRVRDYNGLAKAGDYLSPYGVNNSVDLRLRGLHGSGEMLVYWARNSSPSSFTIDELIISDALVVTRGTLFTKTADDIVSGQTNINASYAVYDSSNGLILTLQQLNPSGTYYLTAWQLDGTKEWQITAPGGAPAAFGSDGDDNYVHGNVFCWLSGLKQMTCVDIRTGDIFEDIDDLTVSGLTDNVSGPAWFDSELGPNGCIVVVGLGDEMGIVCPGNGSPLNVTLQEAVEAMHNLVGDDPSTVVASPLAGDSLRGLVWDGEGPADEVISVLGNAYRFGRVENNKQMVYYKHSETSLATIPQADFVRDSGPAFAFDEAPESSLPVGVEYTFRDPDNDYQPNVARRKRTRHPHAAVKQDIYQDKIDMGVSVEYDTAFEQVDAKLRQRWVERRAYDVRLPPKYLKYIPGDVVTYALTDGSSYVMRMEQVDIGPNFVLDTHAVQVKPGQLSVASLTSEVAGNDRNSAFTAPPSEVFLIDSPLLYATDDMDGLAARSYAVISPDAETWLGGSLVRSPDGATWETIGDQPQPGAPWGFATTTLPAATAPFSADTTSTVTVNWRYRADEIATITDAQLDVGVNAAAFVKLNGEVEIVQFRDATDNGDGTWDLSYLLRGRRGSETMADDLGGAFVVLLTGPKVLSFSTALSAIGSTQVYRGVSNGVLLSEVSSIPYAYQGRSLMPLHPNAQETAYNSGTEDIVITWERRDRRAPSVLYGNAPISETSIEYELDIYYNDAVVRSVTALSSPTFTYTSAMQVTDNTQTHHLMKFDTYQISSVYPLNSGRGFTQTQVIPTRPIGENYGTNVQALLLFEGTDGATTTTDSSTHGRAVTMTGTTCEIDTANPLTGASSLLQSGLGIGDGVSIAHVAALNAGSSPWSIEAWIDIDDATPANNNVIASKYDFTGNQRAWVLFVSTDGTVRLQVSDDGSAVTTVAQTAVPVTSGTPHHIYAAFDGIDTYRISLDGILRAKGTSAITSMFASTADFIVGNTSSQSLAFNGHIDGVRYIVGAPLWHLSDEPFTPPVIYPIPV